MVAKRQLPTGPGDISATVPTSKLLRAVKMADAVKNNDFRGVPILQCVTLVADEVGVAVEYRSLDEWLRVQAGGSGKGCIVVPSTALLAFLGSVTVDEVTVAKKADDARAVFSTPTQTFTVTCLSPEETPEPKSGGKLVRTLHLGEGVFSHLLDLTLPFVSTEETRYYLNGIAMSVKDGTLTAVATDGHRLGKRETKLAETGLDMTTKIIPRLVCKLARAMFGTSEVEITFRHLAVEMKSGDIEFRATLIDGTFPDWTRIVPSVGAHSLTFDSASALRCLRAVQGMTKERGRAVTVRGKAESVTVAMSANGGEVEFSSAIDGTTQGRPALVGINARYLAGIIKLFCGGKITINTGDEEGDASCCQSPMRLTSDKAPDGDLVIVVPMRV